MVEGVELLHGDCLELMRGIPDGSVDSIITDPPYGMDYQSARRTDKNSWKPKLINDKRPFIWWLHDAYRVTRDDGALICFCEWKHQDIFKMAIETAGFKLRNQLIWDREWHGMGDLKSTFAPRHDVVWFATKGKFTFPAKRPQSVLRFKRVSADKLLHATEKPVELMQHLVEAVTPLGGTVLDPFMGSGTTGVACVNTGRRFIGIEKDAKYFEVARDRINSLGIF